MKNFCREFVLFAANIGYPSIKTLEKILSICILRRKFSSVFQVKRYQSRQDMWDDGIASFASEKPITYLEFGVWKGESISHISNKFMNPKNRFFGFDSFIGLPEQWETMTGVVSPEHFNVAGATPKTDDSRVEFITGWFQNSVSPFIDNLHLNESQLIVHFDADLYSSTLYCLFQIDRIKVPYLAIFDEFPGDETRALHDYVQSTGATVEYLGRVGPSMNYPWQVMAVITPCTKYVID